MMTGTNKRLLISESHSDLNQCTSCRRNLIHTTCTHSWQVIRGNLSRWPNIVGQILLLSRKRVPVPMHSTLAARKTDPWVPTQFPSPNNHWSSRFKTNIYWWTCCINLLDSYLQHVITTFNTSCAKFEFTAIFITSGFGMLRLPDGINHNIRLTTQQAADAESSSNTRISDFAHFSPCTLLLTSFFPLNFNLVLVPI
jgi:hypothetical protein